MVSKFCISGCYKWKMMFANVAKIMRKWFLTPQTDIFKLFAIYQNGHKKGHGRNMSI